MQTIHLEESSISIWDKFGHFGTNKDADASVFRQLGHTKCLITSQNSPMLDEIKVVGATLVE